MFFSILISNFPAKANAEESAEQSAKYSDLKERAKHIDALQAMSACLSGGLNSDGVPENEGPFVHKVDYVLVNATAVGYLIDGEDGTWECGNEHESLFSEILKTGSDTEFYSGWTDYSKSDSGNIKFFGREQLDGDRVLDWISDINSTSKLTADEAFSKVESQISRSLDYYILGITSDEMKAIRYITLWEAFIKGCDAKPADVNESGDKVNIGDQSYTVNEEDNKIQVGGYDTTIGFEDGNAECKTIGEQLTALQATYQAVTGDTTDGFIEDDSTEADMNCENTSSVTGWIICPIIDGAFAIMRVVEGAVSSQLRFNLDDISPDSSHISNIKNSHSSLLVTANILFAIGILWIVVSQAITGGGGTGFFGAYEAKKMLPKLIAGIIVANLSWELINLMLIATNAVGDSIKGIMLAPFSGATTDPIQFDNGWEGVIISGGAIASVGLAIFGFFAVSPILIGIIIIIVTAIAFTIIRRALIVVLVVFAPIMLALSPFMPSLFKRYYKLLLNAILFYIVTMISIAGCTIVAFITIGISEADGVIENPIAKALTKLIGIGFYFAWILPVVSFGKNNFDIAGKAVGSLQAMGNNAGKKFGQNRLAGNQRRIDRDIKHQTKIGLKKANRQRRRSGIIGREMERNEAGQRAYDQVIASGGNRIKAEAARKAASVGAGARQLRKDGVIKDRVLRGRFNEDDRRAKSGYEAQVALQSVEEGYKNAEAEAEFAYDGLSKKQAQEKALAIATDFNGHDKYQRRAATKKLIQLKATEELGKVMDAHMNHGEEGQEQWNNLLASDQFSTIKAHDAALTVPYSPGASQEAQASAYSGMNSGNLLTMQGNAAWARYAESVQYAEKQATNASLSQDDRDKYAKMHRKMLDTARLAQETIDKNPQVLSSADSNAASYISGLAGVNAAGGVPDYDYLPTFDRVDPKDVKVKEAKKAL